MDPLSARLDVVESQLKTFFERLDLFGLEWFHRYYGIYRGTVTRNDDPDRRGRIQAYVSDVGHTAGSYPHVWIDPMFAAAGDDRGSFAPPEIGDSVRVAMQNGNSGSPVGYWGGWFGTGELPAELAYDSNGFPARRGFVTRMGHSVVFSDEPGNEHIKVQWHKAAADDTAVNDRSATADRIAGKTATLLFDQNGSISLSNQNSTKVTLDALGKQFTITDENHNSVVMNSQGITIKDAKGTTLQFAPGSSKLTVTGTLTISAASVAISCPVALGPGASTGGSSSVLGEALLQYLATHSHPTPAGPSGPPSRPPPVAMLSKSVKTGA